VTADEVRPLRHCVLRPEQPFGSTAYPGDDLADSVHLGAFDADRLVGIASVYREARPGRPGGWRLRGMAIAPEARGRGYGMALVSASLEHVAASGPGELWCNARLSAIGFYRRAGFEVAGEEFNVPGIGPHVVMTRTVSS